MRERADGSQDGRRFGAVAEAMRSVLDEGE
jgi:hypothetical protein